jgi:hypothetical protein
MKAKYPPRSVFIGYPAKLIAKKKLICDEFPDWKEVLGQPRHATSIQEEGKKTLIGTLYKIGNLKYLLKTSMKPIWN